MNRLLLTIISGVALLVVSGDGSQTTASAGYQWTVDDGGLDCNTGGASSSHTTIHEALAIASPDERIFVCDGVYPEPLLTIDDANLQLLGPGSTPESDGSALIVRGAAPSPQVLVSASGATVSGFTIDALPATPLSTTGIQVTGDGVTISDNHVLNASGIGQGLVLGNSAAPIQSPAIVRNMFNNNPNGAISCFCSSALISANVIHGTGQTGLVVYGDGADVSGNTLEGSRVDIRSNFAQIQSNNVDGAGLGGDTLYVAGDSVTFRFNTIDDVTSQESFALRIGQMDNGPTSVHLTNNKFESVANGIQVTDNAADAFATTVTLGGGSITTRNVFDGSGGALADGQLLLRLDTPAAIGAEFNDWGLCSLSEIEAEILHHPDSSSRGLVDYDPFVEPSGCPTASPSPSASPTPSGTPTPTPVPTGTPTPTPTNTGQQVEWGDHNCSESVDPVDALLNLRHDAGLPAETNVCPEMGAQLLVDGVTRTWGDFDCSGEADPVDGLKVLRFDAGLDVQRPVGCPDPGESVTLTGAA